MNAATKMGFSVAGLSYSPITGPEGNIEYLLYLANEVYDTNTRIDTADIVKSAHNELGR